MEYLDKELEDTSKAIEISDYKAPSNVILLYVTLFIKLFIYLI